MKKLYFVRHGLTEMNVRGVWSGTTETALTSEGRQQAKQTGQAAKGLGIDLIVTSPLSRAVETATIIAKEIGYPPDKIQTNELFIERHFGELEGTAWHPDINIDSAKNVEPIDSILRRARLALDWLESLDEDVIMVVSHGSFGRALRHHILEDFPFTHPHRLKNAELHEWI
jgi:uncharacterized phosphatase